MVGCEGSGREERATNCESEAHHRDADLTAAEKYFQMGIFVVRSTWNKWGSEGVVSLLLL